MSISRLFSVEIFFLFSICRLKIVWRTNWSSKVPKIDQIDQIGQIGTLRENYVLDIRWVATIQCGWSYIANSSFSVDYFKGHHNYLSLPKHTTQTNQKKKTEQSPRAGPSFYCVLFCRPYTTFHCTMIATKSACLVSQSNLSNNLQINKYRAAYSVIVIIKFNNNYHRIVYIVMCSTSHSHSYIVYICHCTVCIWFIALHTLFNTDLFIIGFCIAAHVARIYCIPNDWIIPLNSSIFHLYRKKTCETWTNRLYSDIRLQMSRVGCIAAMSINISAICSSSRIDSYKFVA